jgi:hypothetical protein
MDGDGIDEIGKMGHAARRALPSIPDSVAPRAPVANPRTDEGGNRSSALTMIVLLQATNSRTFPSEFCVIDQGARPHP